MFLLSGTRWRRNTSETSEALLYLSSRRTKGIEKLFTEDNAMKSLAHALLLSITDPPSPNALLLEGEDNQSFFSHEDLVKEMFNYS